MQIKYGRISATIIAVENKPLKITNNIITSGSYLERKKALVKGEAEIDAVTQLNSKLKDIESTFCGINVDFQDLIFKTIQNIRTYGVTVENELRSMLNKEQVNTTDVIQRKNNLIYSQIDNKKDNFKDLRWYNNLAVLDNAEDNTVLQETQSNSYIENILTEIIDKNINTYNIKLKKIKTKINDILHEYINQIIKTKEAFLSDEEEEFSNISDYILRKLRNAFPGTEKLTKDVKCANITDKQLVIIDNIIVSGNYEERQLALQKGRATIDLVGILKKDSVNVTLEQVKKLIDKQQSLLHYELNDIINEFYELTQNTTYQLKKSISQILENVDYNVQLTTLDNYEIVDFITFFNRITKTNRTFFDKVLDSDIWKNEITQLPLFSDHKNKYNINKSTSLSIIHECINKLNSIEHIILDLPLYNDILEDIRQIIDGNQFSDNTIIIQIAAILDIVYAYLDSDSFGYQINKKFKDDASITQFFQFIGLTSIIQDTKATYGDDLRSFITSDENSKIVFINSNNELPEWMLDHFYAFIDKLLDLIPDKKILDYFITIDSKLLDSIIALLQTVNYYCQDEINNVQYESDLFEHFPTVGDLENVLLRRLINLKGEFNTKYLYDLLIGLGYDSNLIDEKILSKNKILNLKLLRETVDKLIKLMERKCGYK